MSLSNYTICDEAGTEFGVPVGFVLAPGQRFRLHMLDENANAVFEYSYPRE